MIPARAARLIAFGIPALCWVLVITLTDRPILPAAKTGVPRAAIAIRDNVTPFQKWGSRMFTRRRLEQNYHRVWYFTQRSKQDQRDEYVAALAEAEREHMAVDVYLLAHTNSFIEWIEALPAERRGKLRFVYNTGCRDAQQGERWRSLGAQTYVGHPGVSASPVFYYYLLRRWLADMPLDVCVNQSWQRTTWVLQATAPLFRRFKTLPEVLAETEPQMLGPDTLHLSSPAP